MYRTVERPDKNDLVAALLPQVFQWARAVGPDQPLTSGVWQGTWADPGRRSTIAGIQLDNSDVISFHSYADPADFEGRIAELAPMQRPILCTEYLARTLGSSVEGILPVAMRHGVAAFNWGLRRGQDPDVSAVGFVGSPGCRAPDGVVQRPAPTRWAALSGQRGPRDTKRDPATSREVDLWRVR